ncbi:MAG: hypothetical protein J5746_13675 [Victivallales bacterium]|nr:hypothetical protein [Victivallales bacterium]
MMTPEQLAEELKSLHYTEKLVLAQKLIEYAYDELAQLSQQLAPLRPSSTMTLEEKEPVEEELVQPPAPPAEKSVQEKATVKRPEKGRAKRLGPQDKENVKIGSFNELVQALKNIRCEKETELVKAIIDLYKYMGGITPNEAKKIIARLVQKGIIAIDERGRVAWSE